MASQTLETVIAINAKVGNGFSAVGATLTELGSMVNGTSQQLINFGKESITVYRNYEKSMTDAEVALSTIYGRGTKELNTVMGQLDVAATEWAATTIFQTNDVANAISEAAHAGWDFDQIMSGIPAAMQLAQAGGLDLSEAVNYIVKSTNAAGISFEDMGGFIDLWAFAANSSASTIGEFGDAMLRMGSTMRFAGNTEELMTLIAITANAGTVGSEAGTMIRNSMMRLIAPTDKAREAMAMLGATSSDTAAIMGDEALAAANAELAAHGFSAFYTSGPNQGQMKNVLDIYRELYVALGDIAGGYENIDRNGAALDVLAAIFPTRTITEALTLLRGAAEGYDGLYEAMMGGDATGYGQYAADTMMDTLDGTIEEFDSKVERLKQLVGEELKPQVEAVTGFIGDIVDNIATMDSDNFSALVTGLEVIAAAGPGLLLAGSAFRLIGYLLTPAGGIGMGLVALAAAAAAIEKLEDADFANKFGDMELDTEEIQSYVAGLGADFETAYTEVDKFRTALDESVKSYETASTTFSGELLTAMLTGAKLTPEDITSLESLGADMHNAVIDGITNSTAKTMAFWQMLFGGEEEAKYDPAYQELIGLANSAYEEALAEAEGIGRGLRDAMTSAFADGTISDEEYANILSYMQSYNDALARAAAEAQQREDYVNMQMLLHKAQTASYDEVKDMSAAIAAERDARLAKLEEDYLIERFGAEYDGASEETLRTIQSRYEQTRAAESAKYDDILLNMWQSTMRQSEIANAYATLGEYADHYLAGDITAEGASDLIGSLFGKSAYAGDTVFAWENPIRQQLGEYMTRMIASMGGYEGIQEKMDYYSSIGDANSAAQYARLLAMEGIATDFAWMNVTSDTPFGWFDGDVVGMAGVRGQFDSPDLDYDGFEEQVGAYVADYSVGAARRAAELWGSGEDSINAAFSAIGSADGSGFNAAWSDMGKTARNELNNIVEQLASVYDFDKVLAGDSHIFAQPGSAFKDYYAAYSLMYGNASQNAEAYRITVEPVVDPTAIEGQLDGVTMPVAIEPMQEGDPLAQLEDQGVEVAVDGDTTELTATIAAEDGKTLLEYVEGDTSALSMAIYAEDGKTLLEYVTGDTSALAAAINSYNGRTITVNIRTRTIGATKMFAAGGRATEASIFGEAGPEWAIPEEHSERTASLLNAAREASGFTWPDLLARFGGLNSNPNHTPSTIVYSPTINAVDASGVDQVLLEDKKRLDRWYEEKQMRDEMEVYA